MCLLNSVSTPKNLVMNREHNFYFIEAKMLNANIKIYVWIKNKEGKHTSLITNFSLSTGNTVITADGFPLSPDDASTWWTAAAAYRLDSLTGSLIAQKL